MKRKGFETERAECPECHRRVSLNPVWGAFSVHGQRGVICAASGTLPLPSDRQIDERKQMRLFS